MMTATWAKNCVSSPQPAVVASFPFQFAGPVFGFVIGAVVAFQYEHSGVGHLLSSFRSWAFSVFRPPTPFLLSPTRKQLCDLGL